MPCRWLGLPASLRKLEVNSTRIKVSLICHLLIDERGKAQRSNPPFALDDLTLWLSKIPTIHRATDQPGNSARMLKLYCSGSLLLCLVFLFLHLIHPIPGPKPTNQPTGRPAPSASFPTRLLRYIHLPYTSFLLSYPLSSHSYTSTYIPILIPLRSSSSGARLRLSHPPTYSSILCALSLSITPLSATCIPILLRSSLQQIASAITIAPPSIPSSTLPSP